MADLSKLPQSETASLAELLATLPEQERSEFFQSLTPQELSEIEHAWWFWGRPQQQTPPGDWNVWLILAGRGWGKTATGAEDVKTFGLSHPESFIPIVAATFADARDTCVEGISGLLKVLPPDKVKRWNRSIGELDLTNGTHYKLYSADEPERLRGPNAHRAWCDELGAWKYPQETWDQLMFGLRLGEHPQAVVTTTPKPIPIIKSLLKRSDVYVTRGNTFDNAANLAATALAQLKERYEGTRLGRQELNAEILDDMEGALWKRDLIEACRVIKAPDLIRIVVAIDPAVTAEEGSDETGIIVAGLGVDGHGYVLDDRSMSASPSVWAGAALAAYSTHHADRIVAEVNNGGDLVETTIRLVAANQEMRHVPYSAVHASRGKQTRAEPVSALYERLLVHHVGSFPTLEDQLCSWEPGAAKSPDRLDALVWALTELMVGDGTLSPREHLADLKRRAELHAQHTAKPTQDQPITRQMLLPEKKKAWWE